MPDLALRRLAGLLLLAAAAAVTSACKPAAEGVVSVVSIDGEPRLVEPRRGPLSTSEAILIANAAQGLVRLDSRGQIEPGLAETWNVSDDGLSYIFRLANGTWPNGRKITAEQVARMLRRLIDSSSENPLKDSFGAVDDIVAMTDRVLEIRLKQPRPHLLQLLAQPEMGFVYSKQGSGPFSVDRSKSANGRLRLLREIPMPDDDETTTERLDLSGAGAKEAIEAFSEGKADLVLGGRFADLPYVPRASLPRRALRFDPAIGLFGLVPATKDGPIADPEVRQVLSQAIDREALVSALSVPGLLPRTTVLEPALDTMPDPVPPDWAASSRDDRREELVGRASRLFKSEPAVIRISLPEGPGSDILFQRLSQDWAPLGIELERAKEGERADLKLIDEVAPATSASWYLRQFRCSSKPVCSTQADELLEAARNAPVAAQRAALLQQVSQQIDSMALFIPLAAPIRWSLVSSRITGFAANRFATHTLTGLEQGLEQAGE